MMLTRKHILKRKAPQSGQSSHTEIWETIFSTTKAGSNLLSLIKYRFFFPDNSLSNLNHLAA